MTETLIIVEKTGDWKPFQADERVVTADEYLFGPPRREPAGTRVINLCRSYRYLSTGYYCSLLAEARRHRVLPTIRTINDLSHKAIYSLEAGELGESPRAGGPQNGGVDGERVSLEIFFGETADPRFTGLARQLFELFSAPMLRAELVFRDRWRVTDIRTVSLARLQEPQQDAFAAALERFSHNVWRRPKARRRFRYDMAVLHNPEETLPPSNPRALKQFVRVGRKLGIDVDLIGRRDYARLGEYDALFIRETTAISDHTYRFAKKAESEGMVVMDDPDSILRCTNKVFLADLLESNKVPMPRSMILHSGRRQDLERAGEGLGFPLVVKIPDGSFSRGVAKAASPGELQTAAAELFRRSDLILAQEFVPSEYDWRIGVLAGRPIFACQYFFPKGHWQIYKHEADGRFKEGNARTIAASDAPRAVLKAAVKAASLIGDGLYGVDVKQSGDRAVIIEVNDNPNIDAGVEDAYLGEDLYRIILEAFIDRLGQR